MASSSVVNGTTPLVGTGALLDAKQRDLRIAQQAAHAERMRRIELEEELVQRSREQTEADVLRVDLVAARKRIGQLRRERERLYREVAEAEQRAAVLATRAPLARDPTHAAERADDPTHGLLAAERAVAAARSDPRALAQPPPLVAAIDSAQPLAAAVPPASAPAAEREAMRPIEAGRLEEALSRLREAASESPELTEPPEPPELTELPESSELTELPEPLEPPELTELTEPPGGAAVAEPTPAGAAWIAPVFSAMVRRDPAGAGRLALALLPAQPLVEPLPLAYDLVLLDLGCVRVTAAGGRAVVELSDTARRREEVQLVVRGELSSLARLIGAGAVRRRLRPRGLARARGSRATLKALRALVRAPVSLEQLRAAGVRPSPPLALSLIAAMVQPEWTRGETFAIAHREPDAGAADRCLRVRDGAPVVAGDLREAGLRSGADAFRPTTTIVCPAASLLAVFDGAGGSGTSVEGDSRPLAIVQSWVRRAQSV